MLIWTTTPWTIPSNLAIAFHPEFDYAAYEVDGRAIIVAEALAPAVAAVAGRRSARRSRGSRASNSSACGSGIRLYDRESLGVLGDYVTLEAGTGAVHTAPGHGADDFITGCKYGLEIYAPVGPGRPIHSRRWSSSVASACSTRIRRSMQALKERGRLWHRRVVQHSYPHCWRCHNPVIFLATSQWFIRMDGEPVDWRQDPARGRRSKPSIADVEVDSRLGPGPYLQHAREPAGLVHLAAARVGSADPGGGLHEVWRSGADRRARRAGGGGVRRIRCRCLVRAADRGVHPRGAVVPGAAAAPTFERERDILDVWFDSGSSHEAVLPFRQELTWPADIYLEGSDQHRGWFQSSLLVGLGTRGRPPFREVLTHGFLIDVDGRKMSKSIGNTIAPQEVIKESGAETLRLWVASSDYREELRVGKQILQRVVEAYRKIRNTCRYLLANLYDFDPASDMVPLDAMRGSRSLRARTVCEKLPPTS